MREVFANQSETFDSFATHSLLSLVWALLSNFQLQWLIKKELSRQPKLNSDFSEVIAEPNGGCRRNSHR